jgi:hypothetical protein
VSDIRNMRVSSRYVNILLRAGIETTEQLADLIKRLGVVEFLAYGRPGNYRWAKPDDAPVLRGAGESFWRVVLGFLQEEGFDCRPYIQFCDRNSALFQCLNARNEAEKLTHRVHMRDDCNAWDVEFLPDFGDNEFRLGIVDARKAGHDVTLEEVLDFARETLDDQLGTVYIIKGVKEER